MNTRRELVKSFTALSESGELLEIEEFHHIHTEQPLVGESRDFVVLIELCLSDGTPVLHRPNGRFAVYSSDGGFGAAQVANQG